jgi:hypothetical protein
VANVRVAGPVAVLLAGAGLLVLPAPTADADAVAYLVNVTLRPGYNFASADAAIEYGNGVCAKIRTGREFDGLVRDVKADFAAVDDFQAIYLIGQAAQELCPGAIWQLRSGANGFTSVS